MRTIIIFLVVIFAGFLVQTQVVAFTADAACLTAARDCTEWVLLNGGSARSLIYRTYSLDKRNDAVQRALIIIHGARRNADHYFSTAIAAGFLAGVIDDSYYFTAHRIIL